MSLARTKSKGDLGETDIFEILQNDRRRAVLQVLSTSAGQTDLRTLSRRIAEQETGESPPPKNIRKSVYNSLHQTHLPKLERAGIVEYDTVRKVVALQDDAPYLDRYLQITTPYGGSWSTYYRTIAAVGFLLVLLSLLEVPVIGGVDPLIWTVVGLGVVAAGTAYQLWRLRWLYVKRVL
ncbi:MAG: hypothetical protein ACI91T_001383 [Natronomonas sp.]|jgi:hypothetical protein